MAQQRHDDTGGRSRTELVAGHASAAALAVPGVRTLVPGLAETVVNAARELVNRPAGEVPEGVDVSWSGGSAHLRLHLAVDGSRPATTIAAAVQRAVVEELNDHRDDCGIGGECRVDVTVVDVTVPSRREIPRTKA